MKKTRQFMGLPVMGIEKGEELGKVYGLLVNPDTGRVDYLLLDRQMWYSELRSLTYDAVLGVGEFAVTTQNDREICPVGSMPEVVSLLEKRVQVIKAGVMTRSGELVGSITEYYIDEKTGKIIGCEMSKNGDGNIAGIIPAEKIITFGPRYIVIEDNPDGFLGRELPGAVESSGPSGGEPSVAVDAPGVPVQTEPEDPVELFESRQRQYLLGKKASRKITGPGGQTIVEEGQRITEDIIENALTADKYIELTMNVMD